MRESIDTAPVIEAANKSCGCVFCTLRAKLEKDYLDLFMGDSKMQSETRLETNRKGFCDEHFAMMYSDVEGRLGLALMTHTHMLERMKARKKLLSPVTGPQNRVSARLAGAFAALRGETAEHKSSCAVCARIDEHMKVYYSSYIYLCEHDAEFREKALSGDGFCFAHFAELCALLSKPIMSAARVELLLDICAMQDRAEKRDAEQIERYIMHFDYRNSQKPWGEERSALEHCIDRMRGRISDRYGFHYKK